MISRCSSPMPEMMVSPVSASVCTRKDGSSAAMRARAMPQLVLVRLGLGLDGDVDDRLGNVQGLQDHRLPLIRQGVAGGGILQPHRGDDVAGIGLVDLFPLVGVHLEQPADALLDALGGVQHRAPRRQHPGVDP